MKKGLAFAAVAASLPAILYLGGLRLSNLSITTEAYERAPSVRDAGPITLLAKPRPLPDIRFVDAENQPLSLADFRGKTILLNIWATWCPPCREEMPSLDRLEKRLGGPDFQVVALSTDASGLAAVKAFYDRTGIESLDVYLDPSGKVSTDLKIPGIPTTLLIDREGRGLGVRVGPAEWDSDEAMSVIRGQLENATAQPPKLASSENELYGNPN
jgi:thiol-disulfide isomerase/thioredoxin